MQAKLYFKCQGFVLCVVLVFLQLFAMLSLYQLMRVSYAIKLSNQQLQHALFVLQARVMLRKLAQADVECEINAISDLSLQHHTLDWWQSNACYFQRNKINYFIVQERLGDDPCAVVSHKRSALYLRDDLLAVQNSERVILQGTIVKVSAVPLSCATRPHAVRVGLQMIRELRT